MKLIDNFLNKITMYRLVLYYLITLFGIAVLFGIFGIISYNPANLAFSTLIILATSWAANALFARVFGADPNVESVYITALILALIISPIAPTDSAGMGFLIFASIWAMGSKYLFAFGNKHIFNPAAFGVALAAFMLDQGATWWISGTTALLPFVIAGGLLITHKIHRFDLVWSFMIATFATILFTSPAGAGMTIIQTLLHSALPFLALVMLTEPLTMPPSRGWRIIYGAIVGILFAPNIHFGSFYFSPELALLAGNLFVFFVSPKRRDILTLVEKRELADNTFEFVFEPDYPLDFRPGQYIEWTLGHRFSDDRGNRRYFTIASAPTEKVVRLGVKFYKPASTFKRALWAMQKGDTLSVSHPAGDFVLPKNPQKKLAFIAGGIGITPFSSMVQQLISTNDPRTITLLYSNKTVSEIAYKNIFDTAARMIGMKTVYALTNEPSPVPGTVNGKIDASLIAREIPDYRERIFYISGPHSMIEAFEDILIEMGVPRLHIKTDYFPGFA